jgi:hypothetical protein
MALILICGSKANIAERMAAAPVANPVANANFPTSNLYGPALSTSLFLFGSVAANPTVTFDKNGIANGGFESALSASDWVDVSVGASNTFTRVSATPSPEAGSFSGKATFVTTGGANISGGRQTIMVRAGEKRTLAGWIIVDNVARTGRVEVFNTRTQKYLTSAGAWQSGQADALSSAVAAWTFKNVVGYTVESQAVCNADLVPLRITCYGSAAAGYAGFDEVYDWPWDDFCSLHGWLNVEPATPIEIHSSTDNFGANDTTRGTPALPDAPYTNPAFYVKYTQHGDRWLRVKLVGTPSGSPYAPYGGTVFIGQQVLPGRIHNYDWTTDFAWSQVRTGPRSFLLQDSPQRMIELQFTYPSSATFAEARDALFGRSALGHYPLLVVPSDSEDLVMLGRIDPTWQVIRKLNSQFNSGTVRLIELPNPNVTNV